MQLNQAEKTLMTCSKTTHHVVVLDNAGVQREFGKRRPPLTLAIGAALGIGIAAPFPAAAYDPVTSLGQIGQTELQQRTGDAVQTTCGQLSQLDNRSMLQDDLFDRCGNMVGNAGELTGNVTGAEPLSLGWQSEEELGAIVQTVANEELAATRSMATELGVGQANVAFTRLQAVRGGARFGAYGNSLGLGQAVAETDSRVPLGDQYGGSAGDSLAGGGWGVFANVNYSTGDRDATDRENEFDYDSYGITVGADYRLSDHSILGGLVSYENLDSEFDDNSNFSNSPSGTPGGSIDADSWGIGLYGTHYVDKFYVDGLIGYTSTDYDLDRRILLPLGPTPGGSPAAVATSRTARGSTDADSLTLSVGGGMDLNSGALNYGPFARLTYQNTEVDGYSESGAQGLNLTVEEQEWDSLTLALGGQISRASSHDWGVLTPYARLAWLREFEDDAETMRAFYTVDPQQNTLIAITDDPDENYFELNLGMSAVMRDGVQAFFDYQTLLGHRYVDDHSFTVGVRLEL